MAQPLDLDPGDYPGTYKLIGGAPALDLANLVSYRGTERHHDWLVPAANADRWARAAGIKAPNGSDVGQLRDLRELIARTFLAIADGPTPADGDIDRIGALAARASGRRRLRFAERAGAAVWDDRDLTLVDRLALGAAALLTDGEVLGRLAACGECRWLFIDATRNRSRRWCDPADCGNRARQRRHYRRTRTSEG